LLSGAPEVYHALDVRLVGQYDVYTVMYNRQQRRLPMDRISDDSTSQSPAVVLRAGLRQAHLERIGGEALDGSGFENETSEPDFDEWE
jgi:hypothetical protein